jgi:hypothetical protein
MVTQNYVLQAAEMLYIKAKAKAVKKQSLSSHEKAIKKQAGNLAAPWGSPEKTIRTRSRRRPGSGVQRLGFKEKGGAVQKSRSPEVQMKSKSKADARPAATTGRASRGTVGTFAGRRCPKDPNKACMFKAVHAAYVALAQARRKATEGGA